MLTQHANHDFSSESRTYTTIPDDAHPGHADELGVADAHGAVVVRAAGHHPRRANGLAPRHLWMHHDSSCRHWLNNTWAPIAGRLCILLACRHVALITQ